MPPEHGVCECGCGEKTSIAPRTDAAKGWRKGEPLRFVRGHRNRGVPHCGSANPRYNGGLHVRAADGRCVIFCRDGSLLYYYRGVMSAHIGRLLRSDEIVHHVNGDPSDDRIENLEIVTRAQHINMHRDEIMAARWAA